jgi:uncharacterized protein YcbK (DUF882 family)
MPWTHKVRHFSPTGDPMLRDENGDKMSDDLMIVLDRARNEIGYPFIVTSGYRTAALQDSLVQAGKTGAIVSAHPKGQAVDGYFKGLPLLATFAHLVRYHAFNGVGLYPHTNPPVIHVDIMSRNVHRAALWIVDAKSRYYYAPSQEFYTELLKGTAAGMAAGYL